MIDIDNSVQRVLRLLEKITNNKYVEITQRTPYYNMAATLTDSVLQAGMNYKSVVYPRVNNIIKKYPYYKTTCDFIILFQTIPIEEIIQWKNRKKQDTICSVAWSLYKENVNTEDELAKWIMLERNAEKLLDIPGIGRKTVDYLKLLCGQQSIPIDRHMYQFLEMAGVMTNDYQEASMTLKKVASTLEIGESVLDKTIWNYMVNEGVYRQLSLFDV